jgi:hypothetical protein
MLNIGFGAALKRDGKYATKTKTAVATFIGGDGERIGGGHFWTKLDRAYTKALIGFPEPGGMTQAEIEALIGEELAEHAANPDAHHE